MSPRPAIVQKRKPPKRKAPTFACHACYRPVEKPGYCERCTTSGAAARHLEMKRRFKDAGAGSAPRASAAGSSGRQPAPPAPAAGQPAPPPERPAPPSRPRAQAPALAVKRTRTTRAQRRAPSKRETKLGKANRVPPKSGPAHRQTPARDAALALMKTPGEPQLLHTYSDPKRVKAALWYLRHRCDLPPGFWFYRDGDGAWGVWHPPTQADDEPT